MKSKFVYIWEYIVKEESIADFKEKYGPEGDWVQLFRKSEGYIETHLHSDISDSKRFATVDFWVSKEARDEFRIKFEKEFNELDNICEDYTEKETLLGDFNTYTQ